MALSPLIRAFSRGARWQQPDYKLVIYLNHSCDLEKKTNFSIHCCCSADRPDLLSVLFYWIFLSRIVQATFLWSEKRLACRLKEIRFTAFKETNFLNIMAQWWTGLHLISALLTSTETMLWVWWKGNTEKTPLDWLGIYLINLCGNQTSCLFICTRQFIYMCEVVGRW